MHKSNNEICNKKNENKTISYNYRVKTNNKYVVFFTCAKLNLNRELFECVTTPITQISEYVNEINDLLALSTINYDALLTGWESKGVKSGVRFTGGNSIFCSDAAREARQRLINDKGWWILDGGSCPL